jgi:hypothetical protein
MAYTSLSAFAAAMPPKERGSSTIGVMTSIVRTIARPAAGWTIAASSSGPGLESTQGWETNGTAFRTSTRLSAGSLRAHPPPWTSVVRRGSVTGDPPFA